MQFKSLYNVIVTTKLKESVQFYVGLFGFEVVYEADWYVHLKHTNGSELAFMVEGVESQPLELRLPIVAQGLIMTFETDSVDDCYAEIMKKVSVIHEPKTEAWGQRHFLCTDPNGTILDIVQMMS